MVRWLFKDKLARRKIAPGWYWGMVVAVFGVALFVRVSALSSFITEDESNWIYRSRWFVNGLLFPGDRCPSVQPGRDFGTMGWGCTLQSGHPGVTTMWAGSLGLLFYHWQTVSPTGTDFRSFLQSINPDSIEPGLIAPVRVPLAIANTLLLIPLFVWLRWLWDDRVALVTLLLVALNPTHVALSRILGHDAFVSNFMILSLLAMLGYWWRGGHWDVLVVSGVLAGLACLSKSTGWLLVPGAILLAGQKLAYSGWDQVYRRCLILELLGWSLVVWLTYFACWPAMWVMPLEVFRTVFTVGVDLAQTGHLHYFLGQISADPGPLFYPLGWLIQASPFEVIGLLVLLVTTWRHSRQQSFTFTRQQLKDRPLEIAVILFGLVVGLFETLAAKKMIRYLLPVFMILDIFAAIGLLQLLDYFTLRGERKDYANV